MIDTAAMTKIRELVQDAPEKGGEVITGGEPHVRGGLFFQPTVIANANAPMRVTTEEIFGRVAPPYRFVFVVEPIRRRTPPNTVWPPMPIRATSGASSASRIACNTS
jgi:succinate-semialdehyde dehydrogenase/glutarate-semialdehyde dehydrogenase